MGREGAAAASFGTISTWREALWDVLRRRHCAKHTRATGPAIRLTGSSFPYEIVQTAVDAALGAWNSWMHYLRERLERFLELFGTRLGGVGGEHRRASECISVRVNKQRGHGVTEQMPCNTHTQTHANSSGSPQKAGAKRGGGVGGGHPYL